MRANAYVPNPGPAPSTGPPRLGLAGIDPTIQIGSAGAVAQAGTTVNTPVSVVGDPEGLQSATLTVKYDPALLTLGHGDVTLGADTASDGWSLVDSVVQSAGVVYIQINGPALTSDSPQLLDLSFQVPSNAPAGTSAPTISGPSTPTNW